MTEIRGLDHVALAVPDLDAQVEHLSRLFGMTVQKRSESYALVADPASGFKIELTRSDDDRAHFRHLGFETPDVDETHAHLVENGITSTEAPHRRDFAGMYTSFLKEANGLEIQLVKYD